MQSHDLLVNFVIYLAAAVVAVPLARRLGLGSVLGYLLAGVIVGPWGLRLITNVQSILDFSEFGVVLMMFVIGLELEPARLWSLRRSIFGYGGLQLAVCALAVGLAVMAVSHPWRAAVVAGLGLALSSTAIALATLSERNLMRTPAGTASFGILLFQDIAAIPLIALLPLLAPEMGDAGDAAGGAHWLAALKAVGVVAAVIFGGRTLLRPVLRAIARTNMREMFTSFSLLVVVGIALLMHSVGLSMALGAFIAGVLLADSEYRHALETDIEPFKGLLLGLFFLAVGMSIDFGVLMRQPLAVIGLVAVFLAVKIGALRLLATRFGIARGQAWLFAFLLSQGGEFAFVVFGPGVAGNVLGAETAAALNLVVALSMAATPLLLLFHDKVLAPRLMDGKKRAPDAIEPQENEVIIVGFGRFGQIVGRMLYSQGYRPTVLDHDPDQIDMLRRFGFKVFYGDATRMDLLETAGADRARMMVVAIDDMETNLEVVDRVRERFPHLKLYVRARNVSHVYQLRDRGVEVIEREMFEGSLMLSRRVLEGLGKAPYEAHRIAQTFRRHTLNSMEQVYPVYRDQKKLVSLAQQGRDELAEMFQRDRTQRKRLRESGMPWGEGDVHNDVQGAQPDADLANEIDAADSGDTGTPIDCPARAGIRRDS
nr:glutathione-regulated potassium-efflux system protein KefC [uncultured Ralstonia sp.]